MTKLKRTTKPLSITHPDLSEEWDYEKNAPLTPEDVTYGSGKKVWWKCRNCGKEWVASLNNRSRGRNCPFCRPSRLSSIRTYEEITKKGTLFDKFPDIASQWDYDKNQGILPDQVPISSTLKVWWRCENGHSWETSIRNRTQGRGCPQCSHFGSSMPEQGIAYYLAQSCEISQRERINNKEVDIFLPEYGVAIEYDGIYFHRNKVRKDKSKGLALASEGITLIRVIESDHNEVLNNQIYFKTDDMGSNYTWALEQLFAILVQITNNNAFSAIAINIKNDRINIRKQFDLVRKEKSLLVMRPDVAAEWNYEKNSPLLPEMFFESANFVVWWKCSLGHEWKTSINLRTSQNTKCPYCSNKKLLSGFNDLKSKRPELLQEWDFEKNTSVSPDSVTQFSNKKVWWKCSEGHEWQAAINNRCYGRGCPYCSGRYAILGKTDLATLRPDLLTEWDNDKNGNLKPSDFSLNSERKVWWKCSEGHSWEALISNRTKGHGCPYCSGLRVITGRNDLLTLNPELAREWNYAKNGALLPENIAESSGKKVWWKCSKGHEWQANLSHRKRGTGCPYCAGLLVQAGVNDLATLCPDLIKEWDFEKNLGVLPQDLAVKSGKKVWWKCSEGHEWQAVVYSRTSGRGCPQCSKSKLGVQSRKSIVCIETGRVFPSITEACKIMNVSSTSMNNCLKGKQKTCCGYHWKYVDE